MGEYKPTKKNSIVREHYVQLGFKPLEERDDGSSIAILELDRFVPHKTSIAVTEGKANEGS